MLLIIHLLLTFRLRLGFPHKFQILLFEILLFEMHMFSNVSIVATGKSLSQIQASSTTGKKVIIFLIIFTENFYSFIISLASVLF